MTTTRLLDRQSKTLVEAELIPDLSAVQLIAVEDVWREFRDEAMVRAVVQGASVPEHNHWRWDKKAYELRFTAYRCLGISRDDRIQGLAMCSTLAMPGRSASHRGKPVLYVKYIESAPWNLVAYLGDNAQYGGVGTALISALIGVSMEEEFKGRLALHSLPQSEAFYSKLMDDLGVDAGVEGLRYFELSERGAQRFMKGEQR